MAVSDVQKLRVLIEDLVRRVANAPNVLPEMHCSKRLAELLTLLNRLGVDGQPYTYLRYRPERGSDGGIIFHPLGEYTFEFCEPPPMGEIGDVGQSWKLTAPIDQGTIPGESAREVARDTLEQLRNWLSWAQSLPDDGYSSGAITVRMLEDVDPENLVSKSEAPSPRENRRPTMESRVGYINNGEGTESPLESDEAESDPEPSADSDTETWPNGWSANTSTFQVFAADEEVQLTKQEFRLVAALATGPKKRNQLEGGDLNEDGALNTALSRLRKKLPSDWKVEYSPAGKHWSLVRVM